MGIFVTQKPVRSPPHRLWGSGFAPPSGLSGGECVSEQTCANNVNLKRRGSSPICLFSTSSQVCFRPHDEASHLSDAAHFLRDLLPGMETQGGLCFWLRALHLSLIDFLGARKRGSLHSHLYLLHLTSIPPQWAVNAPRPPRPPLSRPPAGLRVLTALPQVCLSDSPQLGGCGSEPPGAALTPPLTGVNWFTNPAIPLAHALLSFLPDFLVYCLLPGCEDSL